MKPKTPFFCCLIASMALLGCGNERLVSPTPTSGSFSASSTPEAEPSTTPVSVKTQEIFTPMVASSPRCDSKEQLPLVDAILTPEDMLRKYPIFESDNRWIESADLTDELLNENACSLDCAKQLWSPTIVSIILLASDTPEKAGELVDQTRKAFTNILEVTDRPYLSDLARNAWVAYDYSDQEFVLLYSYGSIFVHIVNRPAAGFDDFAGEFDLIYALGKLQNENLCSSGYAP